MPMGTEGVAKFFAGLGAGPALRQRAAAQGRLDAMREALTDAQIRDTGAQAALRQTKVDALDPSTLAAAFTGFGLPEDQAGGAAGLVRAGNNANEVGQFMAHLQEQATRRAARDAAIKGDRNLANANLFGVADKPVTLSQVTDGVAFDPTQTAASNAFDPTAVGASMIGENNAQAANASASAAATRAKLPIELRKLEAEAGKAATGKLPPISDVTAILPKTAPAGNPYGQPLTNPADVAAVLSWLGSNPGANVADYVNRAPVGSPGAVVDHGDLVLPAGAPAAVTASAGEVESPAENAREPGEEGPVAGVPQAAVEYLKQNPHLRAAFDQKYGAGAAARILGN